MIPALLHHKLSFKQENMEDILTSNVFGMFKYHAQPKSGLLRFLAKATTINGDCPLANCFDAPAEVTVEYDFWPRWEGCEPDVVLHIRCKPSYLLVIEAKYWSGKSSKAVDEPDTESDEGSAAQLQAEKAIRRPSDQLAREWTNLAVEASKLHARPILVYLTADLRCPIEDILASIKDCNESPDGTSQPLISWLSWRELPRLFRGNNSPMLSDLATLADEMLLSFFDGFADVSDIHASWTFQRPSWRFNVSTIKCRWRFRK